MAVEYKGREINMLGRLILISVSGEVWFGAKVGAELQRE